MLQLARHVWTPVSIPKPAIYAELEQLPWPERSAEVVIHALLSTEFWLSRSGWLREWVRFNLWLAVVLDRQHRAGHPTRDGLTGGRKGLERPS